MSRSRRENIARRGRTFRRLGLQRLQHRLAVEPLEERALLSVRVWSGAGADTNWTTPANWVGGATPMADDNLVFPSGLTSGQRTGVNDFLAGTRFRTITISDTN